MAHKFIELRHAVGTKYANRAHVMMTILEETGTKETSQALGGNDGAMVFVVDDQKVIAELTAAILELEGYQTRVFNAPEEALKALHSNGGAPDLLLTDYQMGRSTGLELIEQSKERHPGLRTILLSGSVQRSVYADRRVKPDEFLEKPFVPKHLVDVVKAILKD